VSISESKSFSPTDSSKITSKKTTTSMIYTTSTSTTAKASTSYRTTYSTKVTTTTTPKACPSEWIKSPTTNFCFKSFTKQTITINQAFSFCPDNQPTSYLADISSNEEFHLIQNFVNEKTWVVNFMIYDLILKILLLFVKLGGMARDHKSFYWVYSGEMVPNNAWWHKSTE
jgi:hypothetical protein